jgi:hypothetical protein
MVKHIQLKFAAINLLSASYPAIFYPLPAFSSPPEMTNSTSSPTRSGGKNRNRARPRPEGQVRSGRVSKHRIASSHRRVSTSPVRDQTEKVRQEPQPEPAPAEVISSSEDDDYNNAGTDIDASEKSGSPTDKDTPTRVAIRRSKGNNRQNITSRRLASPRNLVRKTPNNPSIHLSSSIGRSSPTAGRAPTTLTPRSRSPASTTSLPLPSDTRFTSIGDLTSEDEPGPDADDPRDRRNKAIGRQRRLLDHARELIADYTLFTLPFPSAQDLTELIHLAWQDTQAWFKSSIEPTGESLANVSPEPDEGGKKTDAKRNIDTSEALLSPVPIGLLGQDRPPQPLRPKSRGPDEGCPSDCIPVGRG